MLQKKIQILVLIISGILYANPTKDSIQFIHLNEMEYELDCDACGCAVGSATNGMENLLNTNYIGVKYLHQYYKAKENVFSNQLNQKQFFNTVMIWARIPVSKNIDVSASIPYHSHQKLGENNVKINGVGDVNVLGVFKLIKPKDYNDNKIKHYLNTAVGIKVPIAKFNEVYADTPNPSFQLGTGSWDTQLGINYQLSINKLSVQLVTDYNIKGENKYNYKFGNQWNQMIQVQYSIFDKNTSLIGKIGFQNEEYEYNKQFNEKLPKTKGSLQLAKIALEGSTSKFNYGVDYLLPINSNLNSGEIQFKNRIGFFINYKIF